ncbi:hypothetical protein TNCV_3382221 [Trichonephila clavipes]|nr:hypothetical protein TNCV_3382221 [Trichonephila clavipes]
MSKRKNYKQLFLSMGYALPLLQWLIHLVSPCLPTDCPAVEIRVPILQSASVSVVGCSPEDVNVQHGVSPKHPTHVLSHSSDIFIFQELLNISSPERPCIVILKPHD